MITPYPVSLEPRADMNRNVQDRYKTALTEEIRADLQKNRSEAVSIFMNLENDFNIATSIRTHNALNAKEAYIVGRRKVDRRGTVGTHNYTTIFHAEDHSEVFALMKSRGYTIYAVENNVPNRTPHNIWEVGFPAKSAFVFGTENCGLSMEVIDSCDELVFIEMYGSVRSFNLATCHAMILAEYSRQHRFSR